MGWEDAGLGVHTRRCRGLMHVPGALEPHKDLSLSLPVCVCACVCSNCGCVEVGSVSMCAYSFVGVRKWVSMHVGVRKWVSMCGSG